MPLPHHPYRHSIYAHYSPYETYEDPEKFYHRTGLLTRAVDTPQSLTSCGTNPSRTEHCIQSFNYA